MKNLIKINLCLIVFTLASLIFVKAAVPSVDLAAETESLKVLSEPGFSMSSGQTNTDLPQLSLVSPVSGFNKPQHITHAGDGSGRLFVVEQAGLIRIIKNGAISAAPFLNISSRVDTASGMGMMSAAFPPGYAGKGHFYVYYVNKCNQPEIARYRITSNPDVADPNSGQIILTISQQTSGGHLGGQIAFSPRDGYLYLATGDGDPGARDSPGDIDNRAQNRTELRGKMLRIDVETGIPATYTVPVSNPFLTTPGYRSEIWALGLRNPWRFSFDRQTGDLYLGDNGQDAFEEVDFQPGNSAGGENYGWRIMEGNHCYNPATGCNMTGLTLPVYEYPRTGECASVIGGHVYRGSSYPRMQGIYFYGDYCSGRISGLRRVGNAWENTFLLETGFGYGLVTFGEDEQGSIFTANYNSGTIYKIVDNTAPTCTSSISPAGQSLPSAGGTGSVAVTTQSGCSWTASSNQGFISITSGGSGTGSGAVQFSVAANPNNTPRSAVITIAGQAFSVQQAGVPISTRTLTIASSNPASGANIAISPNDNNNQSNGTTQFTRIYNNNTAVTLIAPTTTANNDFQKWQRNGADFSTNRSVSVTMDADYTMTAVFVARTNSHTLVANPQTVVPGGQLTVNWTAPVNSSASDWIGLYRVGDPNTAFGWWEYTAGATSGSFTLSAPAQNGQYEFRYLINDGYTSVATSGTVTVQPSVIPTRTLTVGSANPSTGVNVAISPNDNNNQSDGATQFTRTYNNNTAVMLTAPAAASGKNFQKWQRGGTDFSINRSISLTMDASYLLTAIFTDVSPACTYSISPTGQTFTAAAGTGSLSVTSPSGCVWTATGNASWLTVTSGNSGAGSGAIQFSVAANPDNAPRSAAITVAGQTFSVQQNGAVPATNHTLTVSANTIPRNGSLTVSWTAPSGSSTMDWIGLYRVGEANTNFGCWQYTNGATSGSYTLSVGDSGQYEFRYLLNDGYTSVAASSLITVTP